MQQYLPVGNDLSLDAVPLDKSINGGQTGPQVVGVEHFELCDGFELIHVVFGYLSQ